MVPPSRVVCVVNLPNTKLGATGSYSVHRSLHSLLVNGCRRELTQPAFVARTTTGALEKSLDSALQNDRPLFGQKQGGVSRLYRDT